MNILLINGSPKGSASNSLKLASAFVDGMRDARSDVELRTLDVRSLDISPCRGCFSCWGKTPGACCMHDDMAQVLEDQQWADVTVWSFPLYYFGVPGPLKNLIDRQLPTSLPFMVDRTDGVGNGAHPSRVDRTGKRTVLVSTCGFYTAEGNYDAVTGMFDHICGRGDYETIFCGQGELFHVRELREKTDAYLSVVRQAGAEFAEADVIAAGTRGRLERLLYPKETYEAMANASWGIKGDGSTTAPSSEALAFTRQMALLYNPATYAGTTRVVEMDYTDVKEVCQINLTDQAAEVVEGRPAIATTVIRTPLAVWQQIARGELEGTQALGQGLYTVEGDFSLMMEWNKVFGSNEEPTEAGPTSDATKPARRPPVMMASLLPLMAFWIATPINALVGSLAVLVTCAIEPLLLVRRETTVYDTLSLAMASLLSLAVLTGVGGSWAQPVSYVLYGAMWAASCATGVPFTAHYVKARYGGDRALGNPLFMDCNRILTLAWAVVFALSAVLVATLSATPLHPYSGMTVSALSLLMGAFTTWFQRFYPAWVAAGRPSPLG